jgi:predicted RNase H-like nuclease (RuvC/YqgF family)
VRRTSERGGALFKRIHELEAEVERLREQMEMLRRGFDDERAENERLQRQVGRLRKAVVWLRGALHDEAHEGFHDDCEVWECQRARAVLEETANQREA